MEFNENYIREMIDLVKLMDRSCISESFADKYSSYKNRWTKNNYIGDIEINEPFSTNIYLFPNETGFLVDLYFKSKLIGQFHCFLDREDGFVNDVEIDSEFQNKGLGKVLLIKAIDVAYSYIGGFSSDSRGLTNDQNRVYSSVIKSGAINPDLSINYDVAQEKVNEIIENYR